MNFGERFKSHAKTLAEAAKHFQSFDELAAQDDYIHHDNLNVTSNTTNSDTPTRRTSELLDSLISPISINPSQDSTEPHRRPSPLTTTTSYDSSSERSDQQQQDSHYDEEGGDSHDPIVDSMRSKPSLKKKSSDLMSPPEQERKTANRFMDDLDDRLSKPHVDVEQGLSQTTQSSTDSSVDNNNRWGWMKGAAASRMNELMGRPSSDAEMVPFRSPLSRTTSSVVPDQAQKEEEVNVVQSSTLLGVEDQAELDRIRLGTQGDSLTFILNVIKQHPQFSFIAFTLLLGSAMYFYSRQKGAEDDVN